MLPMLPLGPRIGEIDVKRMNRSGRQQELQKISGLDAQQPEVLQSRAPSFAIQLAQPPEQSFDCKEVPVGASVGPLGEERAVATAQFHFQRPGPAEHLRQRQALDPGGRTVDPTCRLVGVPGVLGLHDAIAQHFAFSSHQSRPITSYQLPMTSRNESVEI